MAEDSRNGTETTFTVSVAASLAGMHAQTLRQYDRLGLVSPARTKGHGRRYSHVDLDRLRHIQKMTQEEGINLAGVHRVLRLEDELAALRAEVLRLSAVVRNSAAPTRGVFLADSSGSVRIRPHSTLAQQQDLERDEGGPAADISVPASANGPASAGAPMSKAGGSDLSGAVQSPSIQAPGVQGALELAHRHGHALARPSLTGWQLLAALRVRQRFERAREGQK